MTTTMPDKPRHPAGTPAAAGGQFAARMNSRPLDQLGSATPQTLVRASTDDIQIVYERNDDGCLRIVVLRIDPDQSETDGAIVWAEEGNVDTSTPATSNLDRIASVASSQVTRLASELDQGGDPHEAVDAFLASVADQRDPFIIRGTRRRGGVELEDTPWPGLDVAG